MNLICIADGHHAKVVGTKQYCVEIAVAQGRVRTMNSSCPYTYDGHFCKHMAAVLFAAEEGSSFEAWEPDTETLFGPASPDQIAGCLWERFRADSPLRRSVVRWMTPVFMENNS